MGETEQYQGDSPEKCEWVLSIGKDTLSTYLGENNGILVEGY